MSAPDRALFLCSCNGTQPLDAAAIARALDLPAAPPVATMLCQKEMAAFEDGARGDVLVACTQEARLFEEMAQEGARTQTIRFVNLREAGGWSPEARGATPKLAALIAAASLPEPAPVAEVSYASQGQLLIVGPLDAALGWAKVLAPQLAVTVLATGRAAGASLPAERTVPIATGTLRSLAGWLGAFDAAWTQDNPIDLDLCTRCHACVRACPEHAIDESYQIDLDACRDHRECVVACGRDRRDRLRPQGATRAGGASTSCSTCSASRTFGCTSRRRATSRPAPTSSRRRRRWPSSRR
jgi:ferredoxin